MTNVEVFGAKSLGPGLYNTWADYDDHIQHSLHPCYDHGEDHDDHDKYDEHIHHTVHLGYEAKGSHIMV